MSRLSLGGSLLLSAALLHSADAPGPLLLVANQGDRALSLIDASGAKEIARVPENAITGHEVTASVDGKTAYVPIYGNSGVGKPGTDGREMLVIDLPSRTVRDHVDFGHGVRPHCPVLNPRDGMLYVTTELDKTISVIDPKTLKIVGTVPTGQEESHMLAISHAGTRGYTANVGPGTVSVLDLKARKTIAIIPISKTTQRISITPDDSMVFTADQIKPQLAVIDTATNKVKSWIALPGIAYGTGVTNDGHWLLVTIPKGPSVAVVDLKTMKVARSIDVPAAPQEVLLTPDGKTAYISCNTSGKVAAIDVSDWSVRNLIDAGKAADGLGWASLR